MGLDQRVFEEGRAGFGRFGQAKLARRHAFHAEGGQQRANLAQLARIVRGDDQRPASSLRISGPSPGLARAKIALQPIARQPQQAQERLFVIGRALGGGLHFGDVAAFDQHEIGIGIRA